MVILALLTLLPPTLAVPVPSVTLPAHPSMMMLVSPDSQYAPAEHAQETMRDIYNKTRPYGVVGQRGSTFSIFSILKLICLWLGALLLIKRLKKGPAASAAQTNIVLFLLLSIIAVEFGVVRFLMISAVTVVIWYLSRPLRQWLLREFRRCSRRVNSDIQSFLQYDKSSGKWHPKPGYVWANPDDPNDVRVKPQPGCIWGNPDDHSAGIRPQRGYVWANPDEPNDFSVKEIEPENVDA